MSNSNLKSFDNFYADLAQSTYNHRPLNFPPKSNLKTFSEFDYSKNVKSGGQITVGGGQDLPHGGKVYLQPDPSLHTEAVTMDIQVPSANGGYHTETQISEYYQKGLMTDEKAGFNSYFLTDTPTLGKDTTKTYMAIRGSDGL